VPILRSLRRPAMRRRPGRQCSGALRMLLWKPQPQTDLGPMWLPALPGKLPINFLQPYTRGSTLAGVMLCSQHSNALSPFPSRQPLNGFALASSISFYYRPPLERKYQCRQILQPEVMWPFSSDVE